ncbi:heavy-metal-associated domain-containing protein [Acetobacter sp. DsW_063]|uniref:heavy-metal-associated domain-containing protein n=1 Tax=Acetobacter sp. DsW_063 TaxID=1514894 RepID=UPI000A385856|nr:heavy metal-associated domain-containing protein [Acetobacter sp. DsW_063]OUJ16126.1 hypothetical protein HK28_03765 [Acetobacter sp. DsW_063]
MKTDTLLVQGMTCDGCVSSVKRALSAIEGVTEAAPSLEQGQVTVVYDPSLTSPDAFRAAIEGAGFEVN